MQKLISYIQYNVTFEDGASKRPFVCLSRMTKESLPRQIDGVVRNVTLVFIYVRVFLVLRVS